MKGPWKSSNVCAWCIYRDGGFCRNAESPVNTRSGWHDVIDMLLNPVTSVFGGRSARYFKGKCGPVCGGKVACGAREVIPCKYGKLKV